MRKLLTSLILTTSCAIIFNVCGMEGDGVLVAKIYNGNQELPEHDVPHVLRNAPLSNFGAFVQSKTLDFTKSIVYNLNRSNVPHPNKLEIIPTKNPLSPFNNLEVDFKQVIAPSLSITFGFGKGALFSFEGCTLNKVNFKPYFEITALAHQTNPLNDDPASQVPHMTSVLDNMFSQEHEYAPSSSLELFGLNVIGEGLNLATFAEGLTKILDTTESAEIGLSGYCFETNYSGDLI